MKLWKMSRPWLVPREEWCQFGLQAVVLLGLEETWILREQLEKYCMLCWNPMLKDPVQLAIEWSARLSTKINTTSEAMFAYGVQGS